MKSLDIVKSLNFGQNLAEERNVKARENILRKGEFLQHSKNMAKVIKSQRGEIRSTSYMISKYFKIKKCFNYD